MLFCSIVGGFLSFLVSFFLFLFFNSLFILMWRVGENRVGMCFWFFVVLLELGGMMC